MVKYLNAVYELDCRCFRIINKNFERRQMHSFSQDYVPEMEQAIAVNRLEKYFDLPHCQQN
ncbi:hypothetical protein SAMN04488072_11915 [Lentibacillus halodurans]|uniref:Uncharacterized protein n=1 Tax=Lentibacillus halodurans TaxID=237679 RepID=A0A1I1ADG2_9BACI|nr:hypothetical protein SAMN04488072_11915 [Lentibacillus halodurans]